MVQQSSRQIYVGLDVEGRFDVKELQMQLNSTDTQVFSPDDIATRLDDVRAAAGDAKKKLNELWVPV